ncbi:TonB-dependent copper receptor [Dokdonella immobilis]|uniref:Iron complex outermembrane recepter protein n=1 Tax=Dokdonella immobilis TaxID=578942 RepID=A0A1I4WAN4_9GAMM|nr:iron complex outermembrane recepter protein [Dokdonella immobilis]
MYQALRPLRAAFACALLTVVSVHALAEPPPVPDGAPDELASVVVTGVAEDAPLTVVTAPKAPRQPVPASDGADLLKSIPGFATIRKGGSNGDPVLRGMAGSRLNIVVDGGGIAGGCPSRMDPPTGYIAPELFDRVIVIKGPQSVIHGAGSSAGTVLFERDRVRRDEAGWDFVGSLLGASWGRADETVDVSGGTPNVYTRLLANHARSGDYEDGNGERVHSSYERWNTDVALGWTPDTDTRLEVSAGKGDGKAAYAFSMMDGAQFLRESLGLEYSKDNLSEHFTRLEARAYYNYADHVMDNYTLRDPDPGSMMPMAMASNVDRKTTGGRVAGTFAWRDLSLVAGIDTSQNIHTSRNGGPQGSMMGYYRDMPRIRDARMSTTGAFAETSWTVSDRQRLISGLRLDRGQTRGYALSTSDAMGGGMGMGAPSTTVAASRSNWLRSGFVRWEHDLHDAPTTLYAGVGHVERFPDYWELFGQHVDSSLSAFNQLQPEQTTQLDIGARYAGGRLKTWVSAYAGHVSDFILLHYASGMMGMSRADNVSAIIAGGEAGAQYALTGNWKLDTSIAYAWGRNNTEHRPLPQLPPLESRLGITYDAETWSIGALWRGAYAQNRVAEGEGNIVGQDLGPTAGFAVFSLNGGYRLSQGLVLTSGIDNVFNKVYAEHVNAANPGLVGYVNTVRINEPGRTVWLKLGFNF